MTNATNTGSIFGEMASDILTLGEACTLHFAQSGQLLPGCAVNVSVEDLNGDGIPDKCSILIIATK